MILILTLLPLMLLMMMAIVKQKKVAAEVEMHKGVVTLNSVVDRENR